MGPLGHSPADVLRWALVSLGVLGDPSAAPPPPWPAYVASEPDGPDAVATLYDTAGVADGRHLASGERFEHRGVLVRVRAGTHEEGAAKAEEVAGALDTLVRRVPVSVGGASYLVHAAARTGTVLSLGRDAPNSSRRLWTVNALIALERTG